MYGGQRLTPGIQVVMCRAVLKIILPALTRIAGAVYMVQHRAPHGRIYLAVGMDVRALFAQLL